MSWGGGGDYGTVDHGLTDYPHPLGRLAQARQTTLEIYGCFSAWLAWDDQNCPVRDQHQCTVCENSCLVPWSLLLGSMSLGMVRGGPSTLSLSIWLMTIYGPIVSKSNHVVYLVIGSHWNDFLFNIYISIHLDYILQICYWNYICFNTLVLLGSYLNWSHNIGGQSFS